MLHGNYWRKSKEVSMGDAYRTLVKAISQGDVPLRLEITAERDLVSESDAELICYQVGRSVGSRRKHPYLRQFL